MPAVRTERGRNRPSVFGFLLAALLVVSSGCGFADPVPIVPSYTCTSAKQCGSADCIEGVCASATASGYSLVLRVVLPSTANIPGLRSFTFDPFVLDESADRELAIPAPHAVYGRVALGDSTIPSYVSFTRRLAVAGNFVDDVRVVTHEPALSDDGLSSNYRVDLAEGANYLAIAVPTSGTTPPLPGIPAALVGRPLTDVFPPIVAAIDAPVDADPIGSRLDFFHDASLFTACSAATTSSCTASGRVVSRDSGGASVPEAGLSVVLVSGETGLEISTRATTAADGSFEIRVSSVAGTHHLRIGSSAARPAFPEVVLPESAYDPTVGGDAVVRAVSVVRYVGIVEYQGREVPGALVRAIARTLRDRSGNPIYGASYETVVRTTSASAALDVGVGRFGLDLIEGEYDLVISDALTQSSVARTSLSISTPPGGGALQGQIFALGDISRIVGVIGGPDQSRLAYAQLQAIPFVPQSHKSTAQAFARPASTASDEAGYFDLSVDPGFYDFVISVPAAEGLANSVVPGVLILSDRPGTAPWFTIEMPYAAVLHGEVVDGDGMPIAAARVEAYLHLPETLGSLERTVALGHAIADADGGYRLLVPSELISPP